MDDDPIYLDHNATTPIDGAVLDAMLPYLREHFGNPSSDHPYGRRAKAAVERARVQVAALIGAPAEAVIFEPTFAGAVIPEASPPEADLSREYPID